MSGCVHLLDDEMPIGRAPVDTPELRAAIRKLIENRSSARLVLFDAETGAEIASWNPDEKRIETS